MMAEIEDQNEKETIKIIICDASDDGISFTEEMLRRYYHIRIAAIARGNTQLLQMLEKNIDADIILLDMNLPATNSLTLIGDIAKYHPQYKVLVFSTLEKIDTVKLAITFGAVGFLYKKARYTNR